MKQSEKLLQWALESEDQAKHERDPNLIARCLADRNYYLKEAATLENKGE